MGLPDQRIAIFCEEGLDLRDDIKTLIERYEIPCIGGLQGDPADDPFHVLDRTQEFSQPPPAGVITLKIFNPILPSHDLLKVHERVEDPEFQEPPAHRGDGFIQEMKEGPLSLTGLV